MKKIKFLCVSALALLIICAAAATVSAEKSRELTANGGYRLQLEWHTTGTTAGITRTSTIKVFARAGEVIKFGSSVYNSSADCDIAVYNPSGTRLTYDVIQNAEGHIAYPANEKIGAYPEPGGIDSSKGVLAYKNNYGDQKGYDFWTYFPGGTMPSSIEIKKAEEPFISVSGCVFFDKNKDGIFDASEMPLAGIGLKITDSSGAETFVTTNGAGNYSANISAGNYTAEVTDVPGGYILTTSNDKQSGSAEQRIKYMSNIGYYIAADVGVHISVDRPEFKEGNLAVFTITVTNNSGVDAYDVSADASLPAFAEFSGVIRKSYDSETGVWNIGTLKAGQNITLTVKAIVTTKGVYTYPVSVSATEDTDSSNNTTEISYTVIAKTPDVPPYIIPELTNNYAYIFGRDDENMMAYAGITRGEACAVLHRLMKQNNMLGGFVYNKDAVPAFSDIKDAGTEAPLNI